MAYTAPDAPPLAPVQVPDGASTGVIDVTMGDEKIQLYIDPGTASTEVVGTLRAAFHLAYDSRIILKRATDGAIVVPSAKLTSGSYTLEEIHPEWKKSYKRIREQHIPAAHKHFKEVVVPNVASATQTAGKHLTAAGTVVGTHASNVLSTTGNTVKAHLSRSTRIVNNHTTTNSHTWTAKLWASICTCAPGPISFLTGVPVEELPTNSPPAPASSESVPLSSNATA